jgi:hypothetical protein
VQIYSKLAVAKVHLIYLDQTDLMVLEQHPALNSAVTSLPVAFKNSEVTIFVLTG